MNQAISSKGSLALLAALFLASALIQHADPQPDEPPAHQEANKSQTLEIRTHTLESGGTSTGDGYELRGVIGQPDAGPTLEGDGYAVQGGLLALGSAEDAGVIFCDGFESGNTTAWTLVVP